MIKPIAIASALSFALLGSAFAQTTGASDGGQMMMHHSKHHHSMSKHHRAMHPGATSSGDNSVTGSPTPNPQPQ